MAEEEENVAGDISSDEDDGMQQRLECPESRRASSRRARQEVQMAAVGWARIGADRRGSATSSPFSLHGPVLPGLKTRVKTVVGKLFPIIRVSD